MRVSFRLLIAGLLFIAMAALGACGDDNGSSNRDNSGDTGLSSDTGGSNNGGQNNGDPDAGSQDTGPSDDVADSGGDTNGGNTDGGDTRGGDNNGGNNTAAGQFCEQMLDAMLLKFEECVGGPQDVWQTLLEQSQDPCGLITSGVDAGRITYHAAKAQSCLDTLANLECGALVGSSDMPQACLEALEGTVTAGGTCYDRLDCAGASYCTENPGQCPGQCAPKVGEGEACSSSEQCTGSLRCNNNACEQPEDTSSLPGDGEACPNFRCQPGLTCNQETSVCQQYDREGDACTPGAGTCETFTYCGSAQTCVRYGSANDTCGLNGDGEWAGCLPGTYCDREGQSNGTCKTSKEAGESCESDTECTSFECSDANGVCLAICAP